MKRLGIVFFIIFVFSLYGGANYYVGKKIYQGLSYFSRNINVKIYTIVFALIALSVFIATLPMPLETKRIISWVSYHWMGVFVYLLLFFLLSDLVLFLGKLLKIITAPTPENIAFYRSIAVILLTAGVVGYGIYNAGQIKHTSYNIQIEKTSFEGEFKIVLISDLHLGSIKSEKLLHDIVHGINSLKPDIVCIAGDIFNDNYNLIRNPERAEEFLRSIEATYGVYAVLGNHDAGKTLDKMMEFLEKSNVKLLNDEYVVIDDRMVLVGRLDPSPIGGYGGLKRKSNISDILASVDTNMPVTNMPVIVIDHTPSNIQQYGREIDLVLSGHTHKGQLFPFNFITNAIFTVDYGHYQEDASSPHFIVTSGVSTWGPPMRVGTNNEIVSILLH
ncbi:MAG TPA: metallophosphoesterase [Acetivibrio saccincola]|uniref:metallophosphoesterase n=1 Tax=Acetivibrio saccincola TaxID=1677857 RepID=UPI002CDC53B5|nr:metallophosphoesterase [Acetivibrio saccincola]HOA96185.1 metallophosphoesterase [Acetivibrio saccincola]HQD28318.1 metallophosphoesterase [Acetivibrio saccincola]